MSAWDLMDWPHTIRHIPSNEGVYDRVNTEYDAGATAPTVIAGHKTVATRMAAERFRFHEDVGELREGDCYFFTTTEMKRQDIVEFNENAGGTIVSRYRIEAIVHRHSMMTKFVSGLTTRICYLLREIQHGGGA